MWNKFYYYTSRWIKNNSKTEKVINPHKNTISVMLDYHKHKNPTQKGDMIIEFNIIYPDKLDE